MLHYIRTLFFLQLRGLSPPLSVSFTSALTPHGLYLVKEQKEVTHTAMNISSVFGLPFWPKIHCFMFNTCCSSWIITPALLIAGEANRHLFSNANMMCVCACVHRRVRFRVLLDARAWSARLLCFIVCTFRCERNYGELEVVARLKRAQLAHTCTLHSPPAGLDDEVVEKQRLSEESKCNGWMGGKKRVRIKWRMKDLFSSDLWLRCIICQSAH